MSAASELGAAINGWRDLLASRPVPEGRFQSTAMGLANAVGFYFAAVALVIVVQSAVSGFPGWSAVVQGLLVNAAVLAGAVVVAALTLRFLRPGASMLLLAVPLAYGLGLVTLVNAPLSLAIGPSAATALLLGATGYMLFRLARQIGQLGALSSVAFALLCLCVLVAAAIPFYMQVA